MRVGGGAVCRGWTGRFERRPVGAARPAGPASGRPVSVATPRGGSPEGFGTAPSEVAPVLLMLDDQFRIRSGDGSGAHLFDAPPRAGRPIFDLVGDYLGGDEPPGADCAYPPLHRIESRFRTGAGLGRASGWGEVCQY